MKFTQRTRGIVQALAVVLSLAVPVMFAISAADARSAAAAARVPGGRAPIPHRRSTPLRRMRRNR